VLQSRVDGDAGFEDFAAKRETRLAGGVLGDSWRGEEDVACEQDDAGNEHRESLHGLASHLSLAPIG
jgi:hypothetical protein